MIEKLGITPGPWEWSGGWGKVFARRIGGVEMTEQLMTVCDIRGWGCLQYLGEEKARKEQDANELLIAAAPEILEALIDLIDFDELGGELNTFLNRAKNAVIKATGKTWEEIRNLLDDKTNTFEGEIIV